MSTEPGVLVLQSPGAAAGPRGGECPKTQEAPPVFYAAPPYGSAL